MTPAKDPTASRRVTHPGPRSWPQRSNGSPAHRRPATRGHRRSRLGPGIGRRRPACAGRACRGDPAQRQTQRDPPRIRAPASFRRQDQKAHRIRGTNQPPQTKLRAESHRIHRHRWHPNLVRTRGFAHNLVKISVDDRTSAVEVALDRCATAVPSIRNQTSYGVPLAACVSGRQEPATSRFEGDIGLGRGLSG